MRDTFFFQLQWSSLNKISNSAIAVSILCINFKSVQNLYIYCLFFCRISNHTLCNSFLSPSHPDHILFLRQQFAYIIIQSPVANIICFCPTVSATLKDTNKFGYLPSTNPCFLKILKFSLEIVSFF